MGRVGREWDSDWVGRVGVLGGMEYEVVGIWSKESCIGGSFVALGGETDCLGHFEDDLDIVERMIEY